MEVVTRYRLYTEHLAPTIVSRHFDGFTMSSARGYWQGKAEQSVCVEIIGRPEDRPKVETLAREIREQYRQAEVWITSEPVTLTRVTIDAVKQGLEAA